MNYKDIQRLYNITNQHDDLISDMNFIEDYSSSSIVDYAVLYLTKTVSQLVFPAKTYAVAIIYATLIEKKFGIPFYNSLKDPDLFVGTDRYFKTYDQTPQIYEEILKRVDRESILKDCPDQVQKTISYFCAEFNCQI